MLFHGHGIGHGADGRFAVLGFGELEEAGVHFREFVRLADDRGPEIFRHGAGFYLFQHQLVYGAAEGGNGLGVAGGVNRFGFGGGAEKAGDIGAAFRIGVPGERWTMFAADIDFDYYTEDLYEAAFIILRSTSGVTVSGNEYTAETWVGDVVVTIAGGRVTKAIAPDFLNRVFNFYFTPNPFVIAAPAGVTWEDLYMVTLMLPDGTQIRSCGISSGGLGDFNVKIMWPIQDALSLSYNTDTIKVYTDSGKQNEINFGNAWEYVLSADSTFYVTCDKFPGAAGNLLDALNALKKLEKFEVAWDSTEEGNEYKNITAFNYDGLGNVLTYWYTENAGQSAELWSYNDTDRWLVECYWTTFDGDHYTWTEYGYTGADKYDLFNFAVSAVKYYGANVSFNAGTGVYTLTYTDFSDDSCTITVKVDAGGRITEIDYSDCGGYYVYTINYGATNIPPRPDVTWLNMV